MTINPNHTAPPRAFHVMVKPRGAVCNLDCAYCFYLEKEQLYPGADLRMSDTVLESFIRQHIQAHQIQEVTFAWQGGEPTLMGLDFFRTAVSLQKKYRKPGTTHQNSFQTNATLLDDEWCQFFHDNHFLIGVSLDGPAWLHDSYRVDKGGHPTFTRVLEGIELLKKHQVDFNILTCVNNLNSQHPLEVYRFLRDQVGAEFIQFIPIVKPAEHSESETENPKSIFYESRSSQKTQPSKTNLLVQSVSGRAYGKFLIEIFDEWVRHDVGKVYVQLFDAALGAWAGKSGLMPGMGAGLCIFEPVCGEAMALEHNGDLYACDHFVFMENFLGNILETPLLELAGSQQQRQFGRDKLEKLPQQCRECPVCFICNGGCPKDRLLLTKAGESGLNMLCEGYKAFFTHVDAPMREMIELLRLNHPPAEIMQTWQTKSLPARKRHKRS